MYTLSNLSGPATRLSLLLPVLCCFATVTAASARDLGEPLTVLAIADSPKAGDVDEELGAQIGDRVRLTGDRVPGGSVVGLLAQRAADSLYVVREGETVAVSLTPAPLMELSLGISPRNKTPGRILGVLGAIGGGYGALVATAYGNVDHGLIAAGGAVVGAALGYMLGTLSTPPPQERWMEVPAH